MRYRIRLINTETNEKMLAYAGYTNLKDAKDWADKWRGQGTPFECDVIDTKKGNAKVY